MNLTLGRNLLFAIFLLIDSLLMLGVTTMPRWVLLIGGICGMIVAVLMLFGGGGF